MVNGRSIVVVVVGGVVVACDVVVFELSVVVGRLWLLLVVDVVVLLVTEEMNLWCVDAAGDTLPILLGTLMTLLYNIIIGRRPRRIGCVYMMNDDMVVRVVVNKKRQLPVCIIITFINILQSNEASFSFV
jgi:hypothetical protein